MFPKPIVFNSDNASLWEQSAGPASDTSSFSAPEPAQSSPHPEVLFNGAEALNLSMPAFVTQPVAQEPVFNLAIALANGNLEQNAGAGPSLQISDLPTEFEWDSESELESPN